RVLRALDAARAHLLRDPAFAEPGHALRHRARAGRLVRGRPVLRAGGGGPRPGRYRPHLPGTADDDGAGPAPGEVPGEGAGRAGDAGAVGGSAWWLVAGARLRQVRGVRTAEHPAERPTGRPDARAGGGSRLGRRRLAPLRLRRLPPPPPGDGLG